MKRPSPEIAEPKELVFPLAPVAPAARLTSVVVFACRSRTSTSMVRGVVVGVQVPAPELKATKRPSAEIGARRSRRLP